MQFHALIEERPGESLAYFRELPGCLSSAPTTEGAMQAAPEVVEYYFRWLKENGIVLFESVDSLQVVLAERLSRVNAASRPLFAADRAAPDDQEIDNALNVAATARALIIELATGVPAPLREQIPPSGGWSLTGHLRHVMEQETWYVSRLLEQPGEEQPATLMDADTISMQIFENAMDYELLLRELTAEQRSRVLLHKGEEWTAAKVLRRMAGHLREHARWMQEIVGQLSAAH
jgi:predicted RNase H-like HicB family nuclease/rubrerythrin